MDEKRRSVMKLFPPKTILVPFDFSSRSRRAWRYASGLASRVGASLHAVYVAQWLLDANALPMPPMTSRDKAKLKKRIERALGPSAVVHLGVGDVVLEILRTAKEVEAGLIVMATEGRTGLDRAMLGSLTEALVRRSPMPVLSLRDGGRPIRAILAPVNLETHSMAGYRFAEAAAEALRASVTLLHVRETSFAQAAALRRFELAADAARAFSSLNATFLIEDGDPVERIVEQARKHDLVVLVARRKGLFHDALLGTTAEQVLRRSGTPVLCVPASISPPPSEPRRPRSAAKSARRSGGRRVRGGRSKTPWKA
jgi:nucleotide-binding universal stress UspA family protein